MKNDLRPEHLSQEVTVVLPLGVLLRINEQAAPAIAPSPARFGSLPPIGSKCENGIYAGLSIENERPVALVLLPGANDSCTWKEALAWAESQGGCLPSRFDQLVLFKNLKAEFAEAWYWSGEQYAGDEGYAWYQVFSNGGQYWVHVGDHDRARAVRRLAIQ